MLLSETVEVKWNGRNRKHYESLGYKWTKQGDDFTVKVEHLTSGSCVRIDARCDYCGIDFSTTWQIFLRGRERAGELRKDACGNGTCQAMKRSEIRDGYYTTVADVPNLLNEWCPTNNVDPSRVLANSHVKYKWKCSVDNSHSWKASVASRTSMKSNCPYCAGMTEARFNRYNEPLSVTHVELAKEWSSLNEKKSDEVTAGSEYRAKWKCGEGHTWVAAVYNRMKGNGCPICNESKGERLVANLLDSWGVEYAREYTFPKLLGTADGELRYDFAIFLNETLVALIEVDGEFHRRNVYGGKEGEELLRQQKTHDELKDLYAHTNDIPLHRVEYDAGAIKDSDIKKLKTFVDEVVWFEKLIQALV